METWIKMKCTIELPRKKQKTSLLSFLWNKSLHIKKDKEAVKGLDRLKEYMTKGGWYGSYNQNEMRNEIAKKKPVIYLFFEQELTDIKR